MTLADMLPLDGDDAPWQQAARATLTELRATTERLDRTRQSDRDALALAAAFVAVVAGYVLGRTR